MPRTDAASGTIAAPAAQVYAALTDPEALRVWLPPAGMTGRFERFDLRPGGSYRMVLTYLDPASGGKSTADSDVVEVRVLEMVPGARVVQAVDFVSDDPAYAGTMVMSWEITAVGDTESRVDVTAEDVPDGISAEDHAAGLRSSLANLAQFLAPGSSASSAGRPVPGLDLHDRPDHLGT